MGYHVQADMGHVRRVATRPLRIGGLLLSAWSLVQYISIPCTFMPLQRMKQRCTVCVHGFGSSPAVESAMTIIPVPDALGSRIRY
jgi:hypothetical protein